MENIEEAIGSDIVSEDPQSVEAVEDSKMIEQCGNVIENKGPAFREEQDSGVRIRDSGAKPGFRIQESGVRSANEEYGLSAAFCGGRR
jgi:hypothetical protein